MNARLHERLDDAQIRTRLREHIELLHALAGTLTAAASRECARLGLGDLRKLAASRAPLALFRRAA